MNMNIVEQVKALLQQATTEEASKIHANAQAAWSDKLRCDLLINAINAVAKCIYYQEYWDEDDELSVFRGMLNDLKRLLEENSTEFVCNDIGI